MIVLSFNLTSHFLTCVPQGDSGGPLICSNSEGSQTLVGITSWGVGCGRVGYPGVATRVSSFIDFMLNTTKEDYGKQRY